MPPVGFEPTISAGERPQTYALDSAATGIGLAVIETPNNPRKPKEHGNLSSVNYIDGA
jgi:hypothetical protein